MSDDHALLQLLQAQLLHLAQQPARTVDRPAAGNDSATHNDTQTAAAAAAVAVAVVADPTPHVPTATVAPHAPNLQPQPHSPLLRPPLQPTAMRQTAAHGGIGGVRPATRSPHAIKSSALEKTAAAATAAATIDCSIAGSSSPIASASHPSAFGARSPSFGASPFAAYSPLQQQQQQPTKQQHFHQQQQQQIQLHQQAANQHQLQAQQAQLYSQHQQLGSAPAALPPTIMYGPGAHAHTHIQYAYQSQPSMQYANNSSAMQFSPQYVHPLAQQLMQPTHYEQQQQQQPSFMQQHPLSFLPQQQPTQIMSFQPLPQHTLQQQSPLSMPPPLQMQTQPGGLQSQHQLPLALPSASSAQPFNGALLPPVAPSINGSSGISINGMIGAGDSTYSGQQLPVLMPALDPSLNSFSAPLSSSFHPLAGTLNTPMNAALSAASTSSSAAAAAAASASALTASGPLPQQSSLASQPFDFASAAAAAAMFAPSSMFDAASFAAGAASVMAQQQAQAQSQAQAAQSPSSLGGDMSLLPLLQLNYPFPLVMQPLPPSSKRSRAVGTSCHQCKLTRPQSALFFCTNLSRSFGHRRTCKKKFCHSCMKRLYAPLIPSHTDELDSWLCPSCHEMCVCSGCATAREDDLDRKADAAARERQATMRTNGGRAQQQQQQWNNGAIAASPLQPLASASVAAPSKSASAAAVSAPVPLTVASSSSSSSASTVISFALSSSSSSFSSSFAAAVTTVAASSSSSSFSSASSASPSASSAAASSHASIPALLSNHANGNGAKSAKTISVSPLVHRPASISVAAAGSVH